MRTFLLTGLQETNLKAAEYIASLKFKSLNFPLQKMQKSNVLASVPHDCNWIFFTSATAVKFFFKLGLSTIGKSVAVVGPATKNALKEYNIEADFMPQDNYSAEGLIKSFPNKQAQSIFYPCSKIAKTTLQDGLNSAGHTVTRYDMYEPVGISYDTLPSFTDILFFSPSAVEIFQKRFGNSSLENKKAAAIGKSTATAFENIFNRKACCASQSTVRATVDALL
ncbi:MAG: uroporphyrinogen-III synthase [Lentisphaeraceae bacterium]|nr:uroporphyrinogen-III synthase [Lentisphaeraceae bacterium]